MRVRTIGFGAAALLLASSMLGCTRPPTTGAAPSKLVGGAVAVGDLARSVRFYTGLGMRQRSTSQQPGLDEVTLSFDGATTALILQKHAGLDYDASRYPGKIVFGTANATAFAAAIRAGGGTITSAPTIVGFGRDPDGYLIEINAGSSANVLNAYGFGASDLARTEKFYQQVFGTTRLSSYNLTFNEYVDRAAGGGSAIAIMHWVDGSPRNYRDNPGKIVWANADAAATLARVVAAGGTAVQQPAPDASGTVVAIARDLDGTPLEIRQQ